MRTMGTLRSIVKSQLSIVRCVQRSARLACVRRTASVHSELGSNSSKKRLQRNSWTSLLHDGVKELSELFHPEQCRMGEGADPS